jgi:hypothetical protein
MNDSETQRLAGLYEQKLAAHKKLAPAPSLQRGALNPPRDCPDRLSLDHRP